MRGIWRVACVLAGALGSFAGCSNALFTPEQPDLDGGLADASPGVDASADARSSGDAQAAGDSAYATAVLVDRPIAYFRLDETSGAAKNLGSAMVHGVYGAQVARGLPGLLGSEADLAAVFVAPDGGGSAAIVTVPRSVALEPPVQISVECWFRTPDIMDLARLVSSGGDVVSPYETWVLQILTSQVEMYFGFADATLVSTTVLAPSTTYHLVASYDTQQILMYVNGRLDGTMALSGAIGAYDGVSGLGLGGGFSGQSPQFSGTLDEVAIYDYALPADRVLAHWKAGGH